MIAFISLQRFDRPWCLWLILGAALLWWISRRSLSGLGPIRGRLALATRTLVVVLLILALAGTHRILKNNDLTVLFLLDQSRSIPADLREQAEAFVTDISKEVRGNDRIGVLTFDGQTNIEQLPSRAGLHVPTPFADGTRPDRTNVAQGLRMAAACAPDSTATRVILVSDGNQNMGDALEEARTARANNIIIDSVRLASARGAEVVFERLRAPTYAHLHEQIPLRLVLRSDRHTTGTILIHQTVGQKDELIDLDPDSKGSGQRVTLKPGRNPFTVKLPIKAERAHQFRAEFVPDDPTADVSRENNVARAFTNVEGPAKVLFIGTPRDRSDDALLVEALRRESILVDYESAEATTLNPALLQDYAAVVLANTPADLFSAAQQRALANYVRDLGGGLIMIGGDESFGAGGWQGSPVEEVMPVRFDVDAVRQIPRGALAIVMHSCEMPQGNKWGIETAVAALKTVSRLDYFGVVGWGMSGFHWEVPMQEARNKDAIINQLRKMQNADMFDFETPMTMAYRALMNKKDAATRHMIIISDGDPSPPSNGLISKMVGNKVTCSTVLVFPHGGREMSTMKKIAKQTGGTYYLLKNAGDEKRLPRIFTKEAKIVRRPLIRDEIFTPKRRPSLSDIMEGIGALPELKGYVVTTPRNDVGMIMPLVTEKGDPLLAHWQCEFGRAVAFTSGRWKHWGADWPAWPSYSKLWAQTVRWCMQQGSAADYDVSTTIDGDVGHIVIETISEDAGYANFRRFVGRSVRPDGESADVPIVQTGPGRYEGTFHVKDTGTYLINIRAEGTATEKPANIRTGVTVAFSPEYRDLTPNDALLREIANETNGRSFRLDEITKDAVYARLPPTVSRRPIWDTLLKLAIVFFLLDVAVRRIAIDPVKSLAYARRYISGLAGRFSTGRSEATLAELMEVRARVRSEKTAEGDAQALVTPRDKSRQEDAPVAPSATAKFDAGGSGKPSGDLSKVMGAASGEPTPAKKPAGKDQKKTDEESAESTMSQLLQARRKARGKTDDPDQKP